MSDPYVLDTSAVLALWNNEEGADAVEHILRTKDEVYVSFMCHMECLYRLWKNAGKEEADEFQRYFENLPIKKIDQTSAIFRKAVEVKATNSLSVCDSWIIATAVETKSFLVHKDPEFEQVKGIVRLKTLPYKKTLKK